MSKRINLVGISGSLRRGSYNTALLKAAKQALPEDMEMTLVSIDALPLYNGDLDGDNQPGAIRQFRNALAMADGFVFASPEYNYSIPGTLKNAIDWASRPPNSPLAGKPVALMGASMGTIGTARMQIAFRPVFQCLDMTPVNRPEVLVPQAHKLFDSEGKLTDEGTFEIVRKKIQALREMVLQQRTIKELLFTTN